MAFSLRPVALTPTNPSPCSVSRPVKAPSPASAAPLAAGVGTPIRARPSVSTMAVAPEAPKKLWGGRFTGATDPLMDKFNESLPFDKRMWKEDITG